MANTFILVITPSYGILPKGRYLQLAVTNWDHFGERGDNWTAYGDKRLLDESSKSNLKIVEGAVQASINEVWQAYITGNVPTTWEALKYFPNLDRVRNTNDRENFSPLFIKSDNKVLCREYLYDRKDYEWNNNWVAASTVLRLLTWSENQVDPGDVTVYLSGKEGDYIALNWVNNGKIGSSDYVALCDHEPKNAGDYLCMQWQRVHNKKQGQYVTGTKLKGYSKPHYWIMYCTWDTNINSMYIIIAVDGPFPPV